MNVLAYVLTFFGAYTLGFYFKELWNKVKALESKIVLQAKPEEEPESTFIDPEDVVQLARFEQREIERKLNPERFE